MKRATDGLKSEWRARVVGAGLGRRLAGTIRGQSYPKHGVSLDAAGLVWTRAPNIIIPHMTGATIRSRSGLWLSIPTPAAGRGAGGSRISPAEWERRRGVPLRFVYRGAGRPSLLVADGARLRTSGVAVRSRSRTGRGQATVPIFVLVPQVRLPARLRLQEAAEDWAGRIPDLIAGAWVDERIGA